MIGKIHTALDGGPWGLPFQFLRRLRTGTEGGHTRSGWLSLQPLGLCEIYLHAADYKGAKKDYQEALLHEIRHCSNANSGLLKFGGIWDSVAAEGDADHLALKTLERETGDKAYTQKYIDQRAVYGSPTSDPVHDNSLYLDAAFNGRALPTSAEMDAANAEAATFYPSLRSREAAVSLAEAEKKAGMSGTVCEFGSQEECKYDITKQNLSPLALRRAELYQHGLKRMINITITITPVKTPGA
jgi:hypothetical protein